MARRISTERKTAWYLGMALAGIGFLLFLSTFVTFAMNFGDFSDFAANARSDMIRAVLGMVLIVAGGVISRIGARGLAGSGVMLDPEQAREDLEPWGRMAGGIVKDALDEADIDLGGGRAPERVVMLKCRGCGQLNEEDSKFCQECGQPL